MTSPVDFISGDKTGSVPGKRAKGKTASFTAICSIWRLIDGRSRSFSPATTRAAILAIGAPIALATKGTVRLARGLPRPEDHRVGQEGVSMCRFRRTPLY